MYKFSVKGSTGVYTVSIDKKGSNLICTCTCNAAKNGMACKHRLAILVGDSTAVTSANKEEVKSIPEYIVDTVDGQLLMDYLAKENLLEQLKKEVPALKKQLSKILPI